MTERCDACSKRRKTTADPLGLDLCRECAAWADSIEPSPERVEDALTEVSDELHTLGDESGALMLAEVLDGYRGGWVEAGNALLALSSARDRVRALSQGHLPDSAP